MAAISGDIGARRNVLTATGVFIVNVQANESISDFDKQLLIQCQVIRKGATKDHFWS
jgi:hypothetical protein